MTDNRELNVLVAEDDRINQELILFMLRKLGCSPTLAENGREALDLLGRGSFDLVFMDISMPEVDGLTATRTIRDLPDGDPRRELPVIALTAHAMQDDRERILAAGADEVLTKPFTMEGLQELINRYAGKGGSGLVSD